MRDYQDRNAGPKEMFPAVCDECGKNCQVPFRPSNNKPIFCSDCFEKQGGYDRQNSGGGRDNYRGDSSRRQDYGRDYRNFGSYEREDRGGEFEALRQQLDTINHKLYQILRALEPKPAPVFNKAEPVKKREKKEKKEEV